MRYVNKNKLPGPLSRALQSNDHKQEGKYSISGLLNPPQIQQLSKRHESDLVKDVSENLWSLFGSAVHTIIAKYGKSTDLIEQHICIEVDGIKVSGTPDHFNLDSLELNDWKVTSIYTYLKGGRDEWSQQLNLYALLVWRKFGKYAKKLFNRLILRDFQNRDVVRKGYPQVPFVTIEHDVWPREQTEAFLKERISLHEAAEKLLDDELPECTDEERWHKPDAWAAKKKGAARATKVFTGPKAEEDAAAFASSKGIETEFRPGEDMRCGLYCQVNKFCNQYKLIQEKLNA